MSAHPNPNPSPIKSILVHLDSSPRCQARLKLAHSLAEQHDSAVTAVYAATPADLQVPYGAGAEVSLAPLMQDFERERRSRAMAQFEAAVAAGMSSLRWEELSRAESLQGFSQRALYADLLVLGQREADSDLLADVPADFPESVMLASGKPALVVPYIGPRSTLGQRVLIAWKETRESARAVAAALPLLQAAQQVHVALWDNEYGSAAVEAGLPIEAHLRRHGVTVSVHRYGSSTPDLGDHLLSVAADLSADLLVMGCYGHSRAREWALGGVSRTVLRTMTIPVLMSH